jgi:ADP-heptose:LPS heptosyltransferase
MRRLDHLLGGCLCFLLARLGVGRRQRVGTEMAAAGPVLFIGLAEMGSVVLADPALRRARDVYGATPCFAIFRQNSESLELTGTIRPENAFTLRTDNLLTLAVDTLRFMVWTRRRRIAVAVDIDPCSNFSALLSFLSGAERRAGFRHGTGGGREALFNCNAPYRSNQHLARNLLALADAALERLPAQESKTDPWGLPGVPQREIEESRRWEILERLQRSSPDFDPARHRILLVNPNLSDLLPQRRWPRENYVRLIDGILLRHPEVFVFLLGSAADVSKAGALEAQVGNRRCRSIAGAFSLSELPAVFACSAAMLTSDSGPAHFAAVTPIPVVVLFGPETPLRYRPLGNATPLTAGLECSPCISPDNRRQSGCRNNHCMAAIGVDTVMAEVERRLAETSAPHSYETAVFAGSA